jgi:hypothetical protein
MQTLSLSRLALSLSIVLGWGCGGDDLVLPADPPGSVEIVQGDDQNGPPGATLADPLIVRLLDESGNGIPDRTVVWVVHTGSGTVDPATGMTDAEGFASAEWTLGSAPGVQRVDAQVPGIGTVTFTATNTDDGGDDGDGEGPVAARLEGVEGGGQSAPVGTALPVRPAVRVLDEAGQPVEGFQVTFVVTGGGGSVGGATQTTDAAGIARVDRWTLGPAPGTNTVEAIAGSLAGSPVVFTAEATAAQAEVDRLVFLVPPRDVAENETFTVQVALVDADGDVVPLSGVFIYLALFEKGDDSPSNDDLRGERFENTQDGVAVFDLAVERDGRYRLRALTDDLPELGPHGPEPYLFSEEFEVG